MECVSQSAAKAPLGSLFSTVALPQEVTQGGKHLPPNTINQLAWQAFHVWTAKPTGQGT